jgi:hypothetical protein
LKYIDIQSTKDWVWTDCNNSAFEWCEDSEHSIGEILAWASIENAFLQGKRTKNNQQKTFKLKTQFFKKIEYEAKKDNLKILTTNKQNLQ